MKWRKLPERRWNFWRQLHRNAAVCNVEMRLITAKAAALVIDDFRSGRLGRITLELPEAE